MPVRISPQAQPFGICGWICSSEILPLCAPGVLSSTLIKMMQRKSSLHIKPRLDPGLIAWLFHLKYLKEASMEYLKVPFGDHLQEEWTGFRPMSSDDMPIIDRSPIHKNIMIATGHGMMGITMAPATGKLIAEMLTGEKPFMDTSCFSIQRFY